MFKKIAQVPDQVTALLVHGLLEAEGVQVLELQNAPEAIVAGANTTYTIKVAESDLEKASGLLKQSNFSKWVLE